MKANPEVTGILAQVNEGALGTVEEGKPYVSAAGFVYRPAQGEELGRVYLLLSDLARHAKNIARFPEISLLVLEKREGIPVHETRRMSLQGRVTRVTEPVLFASLKQEYLKHFPRSEMFFQLPDFRFYELEIREVHWIGGFGKAGTFK